MATIKTLILNDGQKNYDIHCYDEVRNEFWTYLTLTGFVNTMCKAHLDDYDVRTLCAYDIYTTDAEYAAFNRLSGVIVDNDADPQYKKDFFTCFNSKFVYAGVEVD